MKICSFVTFTRIRACLNLTNLTLLIAVVPQEVYSRQHRLIGAAPVRICTRILQQRQDIPCPHMPVT